MPPSATRTSSPLPAAAEMYASTTVANCDVPSLSIAWLRRRSASLGAPSSIAAVRSE